MKGFLYFLSFVFFVLSTGQTIESLTTLEMAPMIWAIALISSCLVCQNLAEKC